MSLRRLIAESAYRLTGGADDFAPILDAARGTELVLIGEASHGTHDFYRFRAEITKRLIVEQGFRAVAIEGDWPDAYRVNRYVRGMGDDASANEALSGFGRFPQWMWRNADVVDFVGWLRAHNDDHDEPSRVGFYGLDLYSLNASRHAVLEYLHTVDPAAARDAQRRYACFDHFGGDPQRYGYMASKDARASCEDDAVHQLLALQARATEYAQRDSRIDPDALFAAEQNARLVVRAEEYYREMFRGRISSWNLRDAHMAETLDALTDHLAHSGAPAKVVVWAHNSHLGNARATEMGARGEFNLGQLVREAYGNEALLVGLTTYDGTVTAASDWDEPCELKRVRPALPGSYEQLFHASGAGNFILDCRAPATLTDALHGPFLERAIGVIYRPETERMSHYFDADLSRQFDLVLHLDRTRAVEPLERSPSWQPSEREVPETYPSAL